MQKFKWEIEFEAYDAEDARELLYGSGGVLRAFRDALKEMTGKSSGMRETLTDAVSGSRVS
jgi:hypothetical protein